MLQKATILLKNLSLVGRTFGSLQQAPMSSLFSGFQTNRSFMSDGGRHYTFSADPTPEDRVEEHLKEEELFGKMPKRPPSVYALFIKEHFKLMPKELTINEKFAKASEMWKNMPTEEKEVYKKRMTEFMVLYREKLEKRLEGMTPEQLAELKLLQKEKVKFKTRQRIRSKLRELNYPKRPSNPYVHFIRDQASRHFTGTFPLIGSPEHLSFIGTAVQKWRTLTPEDKAPFEKLAQADKRRYVTELEQWKEKLSKPENEQDLNQLEKLSRKMENSKKPEAVVKKSQKKVAGKVIAARLKGKKAKKAETIETTET